ncbi:MAG: LPS export ABC transporter periplasmic protein LptC [Sphingobacteriaceae bacterium]|nr:MAG: LPS export ABC transporter periplasmic protein LptC [Sphingobacteriaceae bacterium]
MLFNKAKYSLQLLPVTLACLLFLSCENDLKKIQEISALEVAKPVVNTTGVEMTFSDSALVKAIILTPLLLDYEEAAKPYKEMPKGVKITMYDKDLKVVNVITSNYAKTMENNLLLELRKNVVATNEQGDVFKSEELIYDRRTHLIHSSQPVQIMMANGDIINGTSFESNEKMSPYTIQHSYGTFNVKENPVQP